MAHVDKQLVYITGSGHSGSTLLDMLLSRHYQIAALGEAHRLYLNANRSSKAHNCTCGKSVHECDFWLGVGKMVLNCSEGEKRLETLLTTDPEHLNIPDDSSGDNLLEPIPDKLWKPNFTQLLCVLGSKWLFEWASRISENVRLHKSIGENSHYLYDCVRKYAKKPIVVDSTKTPLRLKILSMTSPVPFRVIYLVRDGRAVTASRMRRQGVSMSQAAHIWISEHKKIAAVLATIPREMVCRLSYENLCVEPLQTLKKLSEFLEVDFDINTSTLDKNESHALGGNTMRWRKSEDVLQLDERWKNELSDEDLNVYFRVAGAMHKKLGY